MELIRDLTKRRFWRHFIVKAFACGGGLSALLQFQIAVLPKITIFQGTATLVGICVLSFVVGLILSWPQPIEETYSAPKMRIRIVKGNLLAQDQHLVVGTCDTFDTEPPVIISRESLQGQALDTLFGGDLRELDRQLEEALRAKTPVDRITKQGKQEKYGVGSIAVLKQGARRFFFMAYCQMNERNEARASVDDVWKSLLALWREVSIHANGGSVSIAVIGGGQARLSSVLPAQDSIRLIALSFMFASRKEKVCDELRIVVRECDYGRLDRLEIQSFLSSLRPS